MTKVLPFWEMDKEKWQMVINTNINGTYLMTTAVIPHMLKQKAGKIINVSINSATMTRKGFSPYGPSKAAFDAMSTIWAQELEGTGITLNIILPGGATETGMIPSEFPEDRRQQLLRPDVIAPVAVYLASEESEKINGQKFIAVDWNTERNIKTEN